MYRILLVDDEALIREAVSENVKWEEYGYELAGSCENGREALEFIEKNPVDVVLTDICMPYMDGMELSEKLSEGYPSIKIIILSGYDDFDYAKKAIKYGVKEYLLKPITAEEMGEALLALKAEMDKEKKTERKIWELESAYRKGQELLYSDTLLHLIRGSKADEESCKELEKIGLNLDSAVYRVAIVELDIYARSGKLDEKRKRESALMAFVLHNISQEMVQQSKVGEVCQGKDHRTYILFHSNKPALLRQAVKDICNEIISQMNRIMQLAVNIGLGSCVTETEKIYISYEEAEEALEYHYVLGGNHVMEMEEIREEKRPADVEGLLNGIALHVKGNDIGKIEEDFGILEKELRECRCDRQRAGVILQRVVDMVDELCRASEMENGQRLACKEEILKKALNAGDLEEAAELLNTYCIETAGKLDSQKNVGGKKYAVLAMDYIEKNYGDCDLSLHSVCSYLNISSSRFSTIFKQATGTTFMDVLIGCRMQKAKELLENIDMKNYEIAERVGFNDSHYFSIAFKKITGKTPTEYAKEMRK